MNSISREALYDMVWQEPMLRIVERLGVSSSYMARVCTVMNVPRPAAGYWQKIEAGKAMRKPPLPAPEPWDQREWTPGRALNPLPHRRAQLRFRRPSEKQGERSPVGDQTKIHPMISGVRAILDAAEEKDGYQRPRKGSIADLYVTKASVSRALATANAIYMAFEHRGHPVMFSPDPTEFPRADFDERIGITTLKDRRDRYERSWIPNRATVAFFGKVKFGLAVHEVSEEREVAYVDGKYAPVTSLRAKKGGQRILDRTWTTHEFQPTGHLRLVAYAAHCGVDWRQEWVEKKGRKLTDLAKRVVTHLERAVPTVQELVSEAEERHRQARIKWDLDRLRYDRRRAKEQIDTLHQKSAEHLHTIMLAWEEQTRVERFLDAAAAGSSGPSIAIEIDPAKIDQARALFGSRNALTQFGHWEYPTDAIAALEAEIGRIDQAFTEKEAEAGCGDREGGA